MDSNKISSLREGGKESGAAMARTLIHFRNYGVHPYSAAITTRACAKETEYSRVILPVQTQTARVLILGGTGRVGGSTATALSKFCPDLRIIVGGRNRWMDLNSLNSDLFRALKLNPFSNKRKHWVQLKLLELDRFLIELLALIQ